jgi:hypothetical protein
MNFEERLALILEAEPRWHRSYRKGKRVNRLTQQVSQEPPRLPDRVREQIKDKLEEIRQSLLSLSENAPHVREDITTALDILFPGSAQPTSEGMAGDAIELLIHEFGKIIKSADEIMKMLGTDRELINLRKRVRDFRDHMRRTVGRKILRDPSGRGLKY